MFNILQVASPVLMDALCDIVYYIYFWLPVVNSQQLFILGVKARVKYERDE